MTIQAAFYTGHKTFTLEQKEAPAPGPGEVQIDVAYVGICGTDMHVFTATWTRGWGTTG
jgi:D-arabinose 1-dehydrogenase-like Zn-dependent alcohol dehydrogenase